MSTDIFHAIADPTRRQILGMTAYRSLNINAVSAEFKISRAAVYKHLKV
jgi:DNA-binding transcriptional ArsR family regulator